MNSTLKKVLLSLSVAALALIVMMMFSAEPAQAHTKCKVNLGFGNWTEGCPHLHTPQGTDSQVGGPSGPVYTLRQYVYIKNQCYTPIQLALVYKNLSGNWMYKNWYNLDGYQSSFLSSGGQRLVSGSSDFYYYAKSTNGSNMIWGGDRSINVNGTQLGMRYKSVSLDSDGDYTITLTCS